MPLERFRPSGREKGEFSPGSPGVHAMDDVLVGLEHKGKKLLNRSNRRSLPLMDTVVNIPAVDKSTYLGSHGIYGYPLSVRRGILVEHEGLVIAAAHGVSSPQNEAPTILLAGAVHHPDELKRWGITRRELHDYRTFRSLIGEFPGIQDYVDCVSFVGRINHDPASPSLQVLVGDARPDSLHTVELDLADRRANVSPILGAIDEAIAARYRNQ